MFGGLPSIDKLLTVLDRYDWMPGVMNTKQDDINLETSGCGPIRRVDHYPTLMNMCDLRF